MKKKCLNCGRTFETTKIPFLKKYDSEECYCPTCSVLGLATIRMKSKNWRF